MQDINLSYPFPWIGPVQGSKTDRGVRTEFVQPQNQATDQVAHRPSSGLTSHSVQTVAVDPFTGNPIMADRNANDVIQNIPGPAPQMPQSASTINAATPLDGYRLALTPPPAPSTAMAAIDGAVPPSAPTQPNLPMSERSPEDWWVRAWLNKGSTMPAPSMNNPASPVSNPLVAQAMAARPPAAPVAAAPQVHAALMDQLSEKYRKHLLGDGAGPAILRGRGGYTVARPSSGVLGDNALMPTKTITGAIRNSYGD